MKSVSGRELAAALERHGWQLRRINGSHRVYTRVGRMERISVPIHGIRAPKTGLQAHLMKQAGLTEDDL